MSELERAKKYLDMIPDELRGNPNDLVQLLAAMVAKVEEQQAEKENVCTNLTNEALRLVDVCNERQAKVEELQAKVEELEHELALAEECIADLERELKQWMISYE